MQGHDDAYSGQRLDDSILVRLDRERLGPLKLRDDSSGSGDDISQARNDNLDILMSLEPCKSETDSGPTGMGPKPETARAILTILIWLAGPWQV